MAMDADWPLPSRSIRIRSTLYLLEGVIAGIAISFSLVLLGRAVAFLRDFEPTRLRITADLIGLVLLAALLGSFAVLMLRISWQESKRRAPGPAYDDWAETRRWRWVVGIGLAITVVAVAGPTIVGGGRRGLFSITRIALLNWLYLPAMIAYYYVLKKIGVKLYARK